MVWKGKSTNFDWKEHVQAVFADDDDDYAMRRESSAYHTVTTSADSDKRRLSVSSPLVSSHIPLYKNDSDITASGETYSGSPYSFEQDCASNGHEHAHNFNWYWPDHFQLFTEAPPPAIPLRNGFITPQDKPVAIISAYQHVPRRSLDTVGFASLVIDQDCAQ